MEKVFAELCTARSMHRLRIHVVCVASMLVRHFRFPTTQLVRKVFSKFLSPCTFTFLSNRLLSPPCCFSPTFLIPKSLSHKTTKKHKEEVEQGTQKQVVVVVVVVHAFPTFFSYHVLLQFSQRHDDIERSSSSRETCSIQ